MRTEEDIKQKVIMPFIKSLGFDESELEFEKSFSLHLGRYAVRIDTEKQIKEIFTSRKAEAEQYLNQLVKRVKYDKVNVKKALLTGLPADTLADYATKNGVDLILIATHGRSGISRWVWGSVADRILRSACVPVFMIRAPGCIPGISG